MSATDSAAADVSSRIGFEDEYPFESHFLSIAGQRLHYIDEGTGDPLLFVHGNPTWSFIWRRFVQDFSGEYRTLAVDHIGCGFSDKPGQYDYRLKQHVDNLAELIERLDLQRVTLIAHDWGGAIAMGAAEQLRPRIARIALMNTAAFRSREIPLRIAVCRIPVLGAIGVRGFNLFARAALKMAVEHRHVMTPAVRAGLLAPYDSWKHRIAVHRFVQDIPLRESHPSYATLKAIEQRLDELDQIPMALIWGTRDWCFTTNFLDEFERRFPQAETTRIEHAGHYVFEDAYPEVNQSLRGFLNRHPLA